MGADKFFTVGTGVLDIARRFIGTREKDGPESTPLVLHMLQLCDESVTDDATAWCSAFVNFVAWLLALPRSGSLAARSWLRVGTVVDLAQAQPGDVVVLTRGPNPQPGPTVLHAPGHVGFLDHADGQFVHLLAGNQTNAINVTPFPVSRVLGIRRLT